MPLEPPPMDKHYESFEALKADVQQHAHKQRYAITTKRSKKDKKNEHVIKIILMCNWGWKQHWVARQQEVEEHHAQAVMQVNTAGVTEPPIQSDEAVEELANEDPAPRPLHRQGTQARQPTKCAAEASTTQPNTKQVRRVWDCGIKQCFICDLSMLLRQNKVL